MNNYVEPLILVSSFLIIGSLIWNWRRKHLELKKWKENPLFPIGNIPTTTGRAMELILHILLWSLVSWSFVLALQTDEFIAISTRQEETQEDKPVKQIAFFADLSQSMLVPDSRDAKTRLEKEKEIIDTVLARIQGVNVSLFGFTNQPFEIVPATPDLFFTRLITRNLRINESGSGTNLTHVLEQIKDKYGEKARKLANSTLMVVMSDGGDTHWEQLSQEERLQKEEELKLLFQNMHRLPIKLMTVGLGSTQGGTVPGVTFENKPVLSKLEEPLMQLIGKLGRGGYFDANESSSEIAADKILQTLHELTDASRTLKKDKLSVEKTRPPSWRIPLGMAMIILLLLIMVPVARKERLC